MEEIKYMDVNSLVNYIPLTKSTIYSMVNRQQIPYKKIRKKLVFEKNEIDHWVNNGGEIVDNKEIPKFKIK